MHAHGYLSHLIGRRSTRNMTASTKMDSRQCRQTLHDAGCRLWRMERQANHMFMIGQYDSPFVRRVAIALRLYGLPFEHRPWSTFGDADKIAPYNPLRRVPTLVLDSGETLIESASILDALDELVGPEQAMMAERGDLRRRQLRICALGSGLADKAVSLIYERVLRKEQLALWVERCQTQIGGVLEMLEREREPISTLFWHSDRIGHADIMVACALRF